MFDVGLGELLILAVLALFVFGPDKLPKVAAQAGTWVRQLREHAGKAQQDLKDSAGIDVSSFSEDINAIKELHPKRILGSALKDPGAAPAVAAGGAAASGAAASAGTGTPSAPASGADPKAPAFDPDAT